MKNSQKSIGTLSKTQTTQTTGAIWDFLTSFLLQNIKKTWRWTLWRHSKIFENAKRQIWKVSQRRKIYEGGPFGNFWYPLCCKKIEEDPLVQEKFFEKSLTEPKKQSLVCFLDSGCGIFLSRFWRFEYVQVDKSLILHMDIRSLQNKFHEFLTLTRVFNKTNLNLFH